jgi:hypothetical protein
MKTNKYLERYIKARNMQEDGSEIENSLKWEGGLGNNLKVYPEHFNYFCFRVLADNATLTIGDARELAYWLLHATHDLEGTYDITREIIRRRHEPKE